MLQIDLGVAGRAPGTQTSEFLTSLIIALRTAGGLMLVGLHWLSLAIEKYFTSVSGVSLSLTELLIVISSLIASSRLVRARPPWDRAYRVCLRAPRTQLVLATHT